MPRRIWSWWQHRVGGSQTSDDADKDPCLEVDERPVIQIQVFSHPGDTAVAGVIRDYIQGALLESFDCRALVNVSDTRIPTDVTDLNGFIEHLDENDIRRAKDCNVLIHGGSAYGGGQHAITPTHFLAGLVDDDCPKKYGSGDAPERVNMALHEVGHALGLPHATETDWLPTHDDERITPMATSYVDGSRFAHYYHPAISIDDLDLGLD